MPDLQVPLFARDAYRGAMTDTAATTGRLADRVGRHDFAERLRGLPGLPASEDLARRVRL